MGSNTRSLSAALGYRNRFGYSPLFNSTGPRAGESSDVVRPNSPSRVSWSGAPITWGISPVGITNWQGLGDDSGGTL